MPLCVGHEWNIDCSQKYYNRLQWPVASRIRRAFAAHCREHFVFDDKQMNLIDINNYYFKQKLHLLSWINNTNVHRESNSILFLAEIWYFIVERKSFMNFYEKKFMQYQSKCIKSKKSNGCLIKGWGRKWKFDIVAEGIFSTKMLNTMGNLAIVW